MAGILDVLNNTRRMRLMLDDTIDYAFDASRYAFADAQREQLTDGFDNTGGRLRSYKSRQYAQKKNIMNSRPGFGNPDLKLTGSFHRQLFMTPFRGYLLIGSLDEKAPKLESAYPSALGLADPYKGEYTEGPLFSAWKEYVEDILKLEFR